MRIFYLVLQISHQSYIYLLYFSLNISVFEYIESLRNEQNLPFDSLDSHNVIDDRGPAIGNLIRFIVITR